MIIRSLVVGVVATTVSACALLQPFERNEPAQGYFPAKSVQDQDPYWRRFYALEQQIAQLQESNRHLQSQMQVQKGEPETSEPPLADSNSRVDQVLNRVRLQADQAIAALDRAIDSLKSAPASQPDARPEPQLLAQVNIPAISGNLERDDEGQIVRQTTISQARKHRYNFSVVYVYPEPKPWNAMWEKLDAAEEQDKWRGFNPDHTRYFIYVGAYYNAMDAEQRQDSLLTLVGERPDMRERAHTQSLAAK